MTAVDTNVLLDVLLPDERFADASSRALEDVAAQGSLVISEIVYAELCVHFSAQPECDKFLEEAGIRVEHLTRDACFLASRVWRTYRRQGGKRSRVLADFLIGAHAQLQATRLLSRDRGFYRLLFPSLALIDPAKTQAKL
ncbi:MAG: type II toxin-antitoxin system VapC family toxin [Candidatus Solibacter usitatus]|nr:type II toxin-antitoxin system VapC family toxin [Candidatus Solibacter usitatus]